MLKVTDKKKATRLRKLCEEAEAAVEKLHANLVDGVESNVRGDVKQMLKRLHEIREDVTLVAPEERG